MPFFSIVIPTFNSGDKLTKTLESVLGQTFSDFEILVMDDGSNDNTKDLITQYSDSRIKYDWQPNSGGPATPRNRGIKASTGKWIAFLDSDDLWYSQKLELVFKVISKKSIDVVCHNELLNINGVIDEKTLEYGPYNKSFYKNLLIKGNCLSTSAVVVKKDFILNNDISFNQEPDHVIIEDYDFWLHLAHHDAKFEFLNDVLGEYVIENHNISHNVQKSRKNTEIVLKNHVFNIQKFESNRDKLWRYISTRLKIEYLLNDLYPKSFTKSIPLIFFLFISKPVIVVRIVFKKLLS
jgi:glycosyltransferase involved in cell wall biosynthesis